MKKIQYVVDIQEARAQAEQFRQGNGYSSNEYRVEIATFLSFGGVVYECRIVERATDKVAKQFCLFKKS